jgi:hypothetical protein
MTDDQQADDLRWDVETVARDLRRTLGEYPELRVVRSEYGLTVEFEGSSYGTRFDELTDPAERLAEAAQVIQVDVCGMDRTWPTCPQHDRGLHAEVEQGEAVWRCSAGPHVVARIGHLP